MGKLLEAQGRTLQATADRARLEVVKNQRAVNLAALAKQEIDHALDVFKAQANTNVTLAEILADSARNAAEVSREHEPIKRHLEGLMSTVGLTAEQVAQYLWYESLSENEELGSVFLDYNKIPLMNEFASGDTPLTVDIQV